MQLLWELPFKFQCKKLLNPAPCVSRSRKKFQEARNPQCVDGENHGENPWVSWVSCRCFLPKNLTIESDHGTWPSPPPPRLRLTSAAAYAAQQLPRPKKPPHHVRNHKNVYANPSVQSPFRAKKNIWCVYTLGYKLVGSYVNDQFRCI